jgi:hypothetical protein
LTFGNFSGRVAAAFIEKVNRLRFLLGDFEGHDEGLRGHEFSHSPMHRLVHPLGIL